MRGLLERPRRLSLPGGWSLRLLSAAEELEARREAEELEGSGEDMALRSNACLLSRALCKGGKAAFPSGRAVLEGLTAGQIGDLARRWGAFDRENNPSVWDEEGVSAAKKAWSTRRLSAFAGACSGLLGRFPPRRGPGR